MKYEFMRSPADQFSLAGMCRVLSVSRSGSYAWHRRGPSARQRDDLALVVQVQRIHGASREAYGARKVWKALVAEGIACGRHRVARVRRENGIEARRRRRFKVTQLRPTPQEYGAGSAAPSVPGGTSQRLLAR
jgi:transposase InsO family protein